MELQRKIEGEDWMKYAYEKKLSESDGESIEPLEPLIKRVS